MAWWHRVGQRVVCVNAWAWYREECGPLQAQLPYRRCIEQGGIYTIHSLAPHFSGFKVCELQPEMRGWWPANRFRPVKDTSIESLRAILNALPDLALLAEEMDALTDDVVRRLART